MRPSLKASTLLTALAFAASCSGGPPPRTATAKTSAASKGCKGKSAGLKLEDEPEEKPVSYKGRMKAIVEDNCLSCHDSGGTEPELDTFAKLKENRVKVMASVTEETMPKAEPLKPKDRDAFFTWKKQAYPETDEEQAEKKAAAAAEKAGEGCD